MSKSILTIIADDGIIDKLATYSYNRCLWMSEADDVPDELVKEIEDGSEKDLYFTTKWTINKLREAADALEKEMVESIFDKLEESDG